MRPLQTVLDELRGKSQRVHDIFEEAGPDLDFSKVKLVQGDTNVKVDEVKRLNKELAELGKERDEVAVIEKARDDANALLKGMNAPAGRIIHPDLNIQDLLNRPAQAKSFGQLFRESLAFSEFKSGRGPSAELPIEIKTVFQTGGGWDPQDIRIPRVELTPQRPISVVGNVPQLPTSQSAIKYMEETTFTNNAVETAESTATTATDLIGEAALVLTERTQAVEWLPVFIPVTMQQMEDVDGIEAYVNQRLTYMLQARLDSQLLNGNGVAPNVLGTLNKVGIQSQAKGADPTPDAVYKAMTLVRADGFAEPSVIFAHPNDWQDIRLLRTADGIYIFGSPMEAGPERLWGVPVVQTTATAENTILLGDYRNFAALYTKRGIMVNVSDSHAHYFTRGMLAIRADMRIAMVHFRPKAFAKVTGV